jgi:DNA-binding transcriptional LysR family regulator
MIDFKRLAVFATVVELGSFGAAARRLGISTSAVSQHLRALEQTYGVTLLHRSTRKLGLTDAGQRVVRHCRAMLTEAGAAHEQLSMAHEAPSGQLRMSAPVGFARHVAPALAPLLAAHPALKLHLTVADEMIDLIDARIDLALRGCAPAASPIRTGWRAGCARSSGCRARRRPTSRASASRPSRPNWPRTPGSRWCRRRPTSTCG